MQSLEDRGTSDEERPEAYLERTIFPILADGLEALLREAKETERRRRFNPLDFLTAYLYNNNPSQSARGGISFAEIPFVQEEWKIKPRPPPPLSAVLTEDEAANIIQAGYRGYLIRRDPEVQIFRQWLKGYRKERDSAAKIQHFWREKRPKKS